MRKENKGTKVKVNVAFCQGMGFVGQDMTGTRWPGDVRGDSVYSPSNQLCFPSPGPLLPGAWSYLDCCGSPQQGSVLPLLILSNPSSTRPWVIFLKSTFTYIGYLLTLIQWLLLTFEKKNQTLETALQAFPYHSPSLDLPPTTSYILFAPALKNTLVFWKIV